MTEEQINIAIAESQGISDCIVREQEHVNVEGREVTYWWELGGYKDGKYYRIPDYANDLNAMHEVEIAIAPELDEEWLGWMVSVTTVDIGVHHIRATARQRAEAYLRTIGRFEDE